MKVRIKFKTDVAGDEDVGTIAIGAKVAVLDGSANTNLQHGGAQKVKLVADAGNTRKVSTNLYRTITSIVVDADVATTAVTITTAGDAGGANSLVAERIITSIAYSKTSTLSPKRYT